MPRLDERFENEEEDIRQHTINYNDYKDGWVCKDSRFKLLNGQDQSFLDFLCKVFHPNVRDKDKNWREFLNQVNQLLRVDGYYIQWKEHCIDKNKLKIEMAESLHCLMEEATKHQCWESADIDTCVKYVRNQLQIVNGDISEKTLAKWKYMEQKITLG